MGLLPRSDTILKPNLRLAARLEKHKKSEQDSAIEMQDSSQRTPRASTFKNKRQQISAKLPSTNKRQQSSGNMPSSHTADSFVVLELDALASAEGPRTPPGGTKAALNDLRTPIIKHFDLFSLSPLTPLDHSSVGDADWVLFPESHEMSPIRPTSPLPEAKTTESPADVLSTPHLIFTRTVTPSPSPNVLSSSKFLASPSFDTAFMNESLKTTGPCISSTDLPTQSTICLEQGDLQSDVDADEVEGMLLTLD